MPITRRTFLEATAGSLVWMPPLLAGTMGAEAASRSGRIDRQAVVRRHNPTVTRFDPYSALSIGNGEFAFTADVTGLQTFAEACEREFPLCTAAHWGWHTAPMPPGLRREDFRYREYDVQGRKVGYATDAAGQEPLFQWLRQNPHRLHLGRLGFDLKRVDGADAKPEDLGARQTLDLWSGVIESRFEFDGQTVAVQTCCHPELDLVAVRVESPLLASGRLAVLLAFPYGSPEVPMADWSQPQRHLTRCTRPERYRADFARELDQDRYYVSLKWSAGAALEQRGPHEFRLKVEQGRVLELVCAFSPQPPASLPSVEHTRAASARRWRKFWSHGGFVDLGGSTDPRAEELERRMVLSLYQTAIHCAGSLPSAETGLLCNSWYGKFHLEMHWWHCVHFAAWNRFELFERSLGLYHRILPLARETARRQGYRGARWPKMIGPDGNDSPSPVGPLLIWQQPHPIYYAELCYRERPTRRTLDHWREVVFETAEFMAAYAVRDESREQFVLGPPLKTVSENTDPLHARNPTFELAYWRFGLRVAQQWRQRLGLPQEPRWEAVLRGLAPLPVAGGLYLLEEGLTDTYTKWNWEHPALVGALGMQPGDGVEPAIMRQTVRQVMAVWKWDRTWGWDYPLMAMAAARAGEPELAIQALSLEVPKNRYWPNGHNYQRDRLTAYLPGNGGLLSAIALMAAGWTGGPRSHAPGFPADGRWRVQWEDLKTWM